MPKAKKKIRVRDQSPLKDPKGGKGGKKHKNTLIRSDDPPDRGDQVVVPPRITPRRDPSRTVFS